MTKQDPHFPDWQSAMAAPDPQALSLRGLRIPHDPTIISEAVARAIRDRRYELEELKGVRQFLTPQDRVLELGSGLGIMSAFIRKHIGVEAVLCVEGNPMLCAFIRRLHDLNGITATEIRNCIALSGGEAGGPRPFYLREPFWSSSLARRPAFRTEVPVPGLPLADLCAEFRPTALIVDIEGGEAGLFEGTDLHEVRHVFLELHTRAIGLEGVKGCFDALSRLGFAYEQKVSGGSTVLFRKLAPAGRRTRRRATA